MLSAFQLTKNSFFDRKPIVDAVGRAKVKVLSRQGALVRKIVRNSIRKRKKAAGPGSPPSSHGGELKDFLFYSYDSKTQTVVVGPTKLGKGEAPATLEFGGEVKQLGIYDRAGKFIPLKFLPARSRERLRKLNKLKSRSAKVDARPYMEPGLEKAAPSFAKMWQDQVK
jgi:hypothetical protein